MKNFNPQRFAHMLRYTFVTSRRTMINGVVGMLLCYLFMFIMANLNNVMMMPVVNQALAMSTIATIIFIMVSAATLFRAEESNQGRAALMLLPATNLEKFLARWVWLLVFTLAGVLMFVVADGLHYAYHFALGHEAISGVGCLLSLTDVVYVSDHQRTMNLLSNADIFLVFTAIHAFCLLGSTLVRRNAVVITAVALGVGMAVYLWLLENGLRYLPQEQLLWGILVVAAVCIVLFIWLAYRSFCRWQLITRKYLSL